MPEAITNYAKIRPARQAAAAVLQQVLANAPFQGNVSASTVQYAWIVETLPNRARKQAGLVNPTPAY